MANVGHKAILILDCSPKFAKYSEVELEVTYKDGINQNKIGFEPKTLWNCSLDAAVEFQRIVTDIFPTGTHMTKYIISGATSSLVFKHWQAVAMNEEEFIQALFEAGCKNVDPELDQASCSVKKSLSLAISSFNQYSPFQEDQKKKQLCDTKKNYHKVVEQEREIEPALLKNFRYNIPNDGTLFIITSFNAEYEFVELGESIAARVNAANRNIDNSKDHSQLPVDTLNVFVLNFANNFDEVSFPVKPITKKYNDGYLKCTMYTITGKATTGYLHRVIMEAYDLVSTTITGIPMKEESSATTEYDVEIFHPKALHNALEKAGLLQANKGLTKISQQGGYNTVRLSWCNPVQKLRKDAFPLREFGSYATPADILSRPTLCVTSFLKKGKSIWLEASVDKAVVQNVPGKVVTHFLTLDCYRQGIIVQELAIDDKVINHEFQLKKVMEENVNFNFIGASGGAVFTDSKLDELSEITVDCFPKERDMNDDEEMCTGSDADSNEVDFVNEDVNFSYLEGVRQEFEFDHQGVSKSMYPKHAKYESLRKLIRSGNASAELRAAISKLITNFSGELKIYDQSTTKRDELDNQFFAFCDIVEDLEKVNPKMHDEFHLQMIKVTARYRRIRKPSTLILVLLPEMFHSKPRPDRIEPLCFQRGGMLELYKDLKVDESKPKKAKLDQPETEEGETRDDSMEDVVEQKTAVKDENVKA